MARLGRGAWRNEDGRALATIAIAGMPGYTVDLIAECDGGGPSILLPDLRFSGGIAEATIRGPENPGDPKHPGLYPWRPTLVLSWHNDPSVATASDAGLLVSDKESDHGMQRAARRVLARIGEGGRTSRHEDRIAAMVETARELRAEGREPTRENVAKSLGKMSAWGELPGQYKKDVRKAGGWPAILARAK